MKLQRLHIKGFRNINDLDLNLSDQDGVSVLIGNNGTGKSNILEAVVAIFTSLYNKSKRFKLDFEYDIVYILDDHTIEIKDSGCQIYLDGTKINRKQLSNYLPKNIIATYSGETSRLEEKYFKPFRKAYINRCISGNHASQQLWFINKELWNISLLSLFLHPFEEFSDIKDFCNEILQIKNIEKITFSIFPHRLTHNNEAKQLLDAIVPQNLDTNKVTLSFHDFKVAIDAIHFTPKEVFQALYIGHYAGGFFNMQLIVKGNNDNTFDANLLSEGEKKLLAVFTMLEVLGDEKSLMLYDEPDSHIHISRKNEINKLIGKYSNRQHILTTHSPTLAKSFFDPLSHLNYLAKNGTGYVERIEKDKCSLIAELTDNIWSVSDQNTFLASSKPITLLVEGKTDKIHIEEAFKRLKDDYQDLDFDIFHFGGATNIPQFVIGLKTCEIDFSNRVIIAIFDNDEEGRNCCKQTQAKYSKKKNKYGLYAITLPLKDSATIENMYDQSKYDTAFKTAVSKNTFVGLVSEYAELITKQAKIELSNMAKGFNLEDFKKFRLLFDIIKEIKDL
ncbi:MAG TPA: AAA family ATPase [Bacteroidaceae bacterium]|nr:AAA family ATPase [Bacteroidaceae bacterium]